MWRTTILSYGSYGCTSNNQFLIRVKQGDTLVFSTCSTEYSPATTFTLTPGVWQHVTLTYKSGALKFYKVILLIFLIFYH